MDRVSEFRRRTRCGLLAVVVLIYGTVHGGTGEWLNGRVSRRCAISTALVLTLSCEAIWHLRTLPAPPLTGRMIDSIARLYADRPVCVKATAMQRDPDRLLPSDDGVRVDGNEYFIEVSRRSSFKPYMEPYREI